MAITRLNSLAIPAGTIVESDLSYPLTNFSSTGIDDNATSTAITIDASENVGIGTTSPSRPLSIEGTGTTYMAIVSPAANTAGLLLGDTTSDSQGRIQYNNPNDALQVFTAGSERMRIDASGNVGIKTTSPSFPLAGQLHISGGTGYVGLNLQKGSAGTGHLLEFTDENNTLQYRIGTNFASGGQNLLFAYGSTPTIGMTLNSSGNVGIGTASPQFQVHLSGSAPGTVFSETGAIKYYRNRAAASALTWDILNTDYSFNSEVMRINSSGAVLVGTTSDSNITGTGVKLFPQGYGGASSAVGVVGSSAGSTNSGFRMYSTGAGAYRFYVDYAGTIFATSTSISAISDASLKENVRDLDKGLDTINALQPRRFDWKNGDGNDIMGFIAQEVEEVMPELVHEYKYSDEETKKGLKMGDMVPSMVKAIQELSAQVNELKAEVAALKGA